MRSMLSHNEAVKECKIINGILALNPLHGRVVSTRLHVTRSLYKRGSTKSCSAWGGSVQANQYDAIQAI